MAQTMVPSPSVQAKARELLARRSEWATVRSRGYRRVVVPSCSGDGVYYVDPAGRACSCRAGQRGLICAHRIAVAESSHQESLSNQTTYHEQLKAREKILRLMGWERDEYSDDSRWSKLAEWVERAERGGAR